MLFWKKKPKKQPKPKKKPINSSPIVPEASKSPPMQKPTPRPRPEIPRMVKKESEFKSAAEMGKAIAKGFTDGHAEKTHEPSSTRRDSDKEFMRIFKQLTYRHRAWDVWQDFVTMFACAISNAVDKSHYDEREALYMRTIKKYNKQEQTLFRELTEETIMALEANLEQDFLGKMFMSLELGDKAKAQIFTPYHVCDFMAKISMGDDVAAMVKEKGYITINDPCCGAGATLIAGANEARKQLEKVGLNFQNHVLIVAQDIDETVALMCYIQLSLMGMAGYIKIGNSLTEPMCSDDTLENYWFTPIYFSNVWVMRRLFYGKKL